MCRRAYAADSQVITSAAHEEREIPRHQSISCVDRMQKYRPKGGHDDDITSDRETSDSEHGARVCAMGSFSLGSR